MMLKKTLSQEHCQNQFIELETFKRKVDCVLEKHAPLRKCFVRANQAPFIDKYINKQIVKRSRLPKKFLNSKSYTDPKAYNAQRNLCVSLIRQAKKQYFSNLNTHDVTDNTTFWKRVKPLLTNNVNTKSKITLIEKKYKDNSTEYSEEIISDDKEVSEVFNIFFVNIISDLKIPASQNWNNCFQKKNDPVLNA